MIAEFIIALSITGANQHTPSQVSTPGVFVAAQLTQSRIL
jgi:hypothetical protein